MIIELLGKLGKYLFFKYCKPDLAAMTRIQMQGERKPGAFKKLNDQEKSIIYKECEILLKNPTFNFLVDEVRDDTADHIVFTANDKEVILADRFTINGASLVRENAAKYAAQVEEVAKDYTQNPERFDGI